MSVADSIAQGQAHTHGCATIGHAPTRKDVGDRADEADFEESNTDNEGQDRPVPCGDAQHRQASQQRDRVDHAATHQTRRLPDASADDRGGVDVGGGMRR